MKGKKTDEKATFIKTLTTLGFVLAFINYGIPFFSRLITGPEYDMPVPVVLKVVYGTLAIVATYMYVSYDEWRYRSFLRPPLRLLKGHYGKKTRTFVLVIVPLLLGSIVYRYSLPKISLPIAMRIRHPSSNFPQKFGDLKNPFRNPSNKEIDHFIEQVKTKKVSFHPETGRGIGGVEFIPAKPVQEFLRDLKNGQTDRKMAAAALLEKNRYEGRVLYEINCRPCHGVNGAGNGPMASGFELRPINFTDSGTIDVLVEGYTFWRISTGGPGLPDEATPWDSAMPIWRLDLTEDERWKILLALFDLTGKSPRIPENLE